MSETDRVRRIGGGRVLRGEMQRRSISKTSEMVRRLQGFNFALGVRRG